MLTWEDDLEGHALRRRGWSISAIARHTSLDRKTVRKYLNGDGKPGVRARSGPDPFDPFVDYVTARLTEDPHLWARTLLDELEQLGFGLSYQSLTRHIRARNLRPVCEACRTATQRPNAVIPHKPGDETQWDWLELPDPPEFWGGARPRICWWARWRIRASGAQPWRPRKTSRTWWPASTACPAAWAASRGCGASTEWPRCVIPARVG